MRTAVAELVAVATAMTFRRPGTMAPAIGVGVERDADVDAVAVSNPRAHLSIPAQRESLAIHAHRRCRGNSAPRTSLMWPLHLSGRELLYAIDRHRCVVVSGQTGSGKSTQIPQYLVTASIWRHLLPR